MIYERIEDNLNQALSLVGRIEEVYRRVGRRCGGWRTSSSSTTSGVDMGDEAEVAGSTLREPWATLLSEDFQRQMILNARNPDRVLVGQGSKMTYLVPREVPREGIEPSPSPMLYCRVPASHGGCFRFSPV
jgi:hypothetical protein